jgi:hypothetical protein
MPNAQREPTQVRRVPTVRLLNHLAEEGTFSAVSLRSFFRVTHGGASPFTLVALAELLDPVPRTTRPALSSRPTL